MAKGKKRDIKRGIFPKYKKLYEWILSILPECISDKKYSLPTKIFWILNGITSWDNSIVKCKNCGNSYYALPSNLLKGYNCKQCYLKSKFKTKEEYEQDVLQYNSQIKVFDDYNTRTHKNSKCTFQCITCGYMFQEIPRIFLQNKCKCSNCEHNLPFTPEEIKSKITNLNPNIILLKEIKKFTGRADCYCKICKNTWNTEISHFIYNNARCPHCSYIESGKKKRKTNEVFIMQLKNKNIHKITPISNYVSVNDNILVKCDICNYIWNTKHPENTDNSPVSL